MALSFFALAAYVSIESVRVLVGGHEPDPSAVGIGLATASLAIMPFLSWAQRRTGRSLGSNAVLAGSTQTLLGTYLSAVLLAGLVVNATRGCACGPTVTDQVTLEVTATQGCADDCCHDT